MADQIEFSRESFEKFKKRYEEAVAAGQDQFVFEGHDVLTSYAKYMIEYAESQFDV